MKKGLGRSGGQIGHGRINKWVTCALGLLICLAPVSSLAQTAMTQRGYLQSMAKICGDSRASSGTDTVLIQWAQARGMNPAGGWNLDARLTKEAMAHTMVQLLKLPPGKGNFDAVRILEREGIFIQTSGGYVAAGDFRRVINNDIVRRASSSKQGGNNNNQGHNGQGHDGDDDDDDDDHGKPPTKTKPGHGKGDKNHDHTGPPGQDKDKGKGGKN